MRECPGGQVRVPRGTGERVSRRDRWECPGGTDERVRGRDRWESVREDRWECPGAKISLWGHSHTFVYSARAQACTHPHTHTLHSSQEPVQNLPRAALHSTLTLQNHFWPSSWLFTFDLEHGWCPSRYLSHSAYNAWIKIHACPFNLFCKLPEGVRALGKDGVRGQATCQPPGRGQGHWHSRIQSRRVAVVSADSWSRVPTCYESQRASCGFIYSLYCFIFFFIYSPFDIYHLLYSTYFGFKMLFLLFQFLQVETEIFKWRTFFFDCDKMYLK